MGTNAGDEAGEAIRPMLIGPYGRESEEHRRPHSTKEVLAKPTGSPQARDALQRSAGSFRNRPAFVSLPGAVARNSPGERGLGVNTVMAV